MDTSLEVDKFFVLRTTAIILMPCIVKVSTESNRLERPQSHASDYRGEKRRSGRLNFNGSTTELPSARGHYDSDSLIRTTLIAIDRRGNAIASVRPIGFALHCRRNKSLARRTHVQMSAAAATAAGGRENRDFRLPAVLFRCRRQTAALSACTREIRRDPDDFRVGRSTGVWRDRSGYTIVGY